MSTESVFVLLFLVAAGVAILVRRLPIPYTVGLVVAGLVLGELHVLPAPPLTKQLLFTVFLPGLLFEAAFHLELTEFRRNLPAIASLAVPGVVAGMGLIALILAPAGRLLGFGEGFDWRYALVFGALIAATDPIAVVGLFRNLGTPSRLSVLMQGESLLNDGTGIVLFTLSVAIVSGSETSAGNLVLQFVEIVGLAIVIGISVGLLVSHALRQVNDPMVEITLTTIAAYGSFVVAEHFGCSGVIATVVSGLVCGNYGARVGMAPTTRLAVESFWEYLAFALNSVVFLLIGFEVKLSDLLLSWPMILVAYLAVTLGRALIMSVGSLIFRWTRASFPFSWTAVLVWGGLRGALPMVLALSLSQDFPQRDVIVQMTFGVVVISILVQGLTMAPLLRWLGLVGIREEYVEYERSRAVLRATQSALSELERLARGGYSDSVRSDVRELYQERLVQTKSRIDDLHSRYEFLRHEELRELHRRLIRVEKKVVIEELQEGGIHHEVYRELLEDLDRRLLELESQEEAAARSWEESD